MYEEYKVNLSSLDSIRKNGVSGLMRVKDDAEFISESVDSVISCLDELIICYQKSSDNTEEIIYKIKNKYPDKIHIYFYEPKVKSHNLTDEEWREIENIDNNSIYLLSNYYNYTLSKSQYKYAVKIDADQIYITEKFKEICNLYRATDKVNKNTFGCLAFWYYKIIAKVGVLVPNLINKFTIRILFPNFIIKNLRKYIKIKIQNEKVISSFEGLNIYFIGENEYICGGCFSDGVQPPIGGCGDHIFFPVCAANHYTPKFEKKYNRVIEVMRPSTRVYFGLGFLWFHLNALRKRNYPANYNKYKNKLLSFQYFKSVWDLKKYMIPKTMIVTVMMDYKYDQKYLNRYFNTIKQNILNIIK